MVTMITREDLLKAKKVLEKRGFVHILSVMQSDKNSSYGLLYKRCNEEFWLNKDTIEGVLKS